MHNKQTDQQLNSFKATSFHDSRYWFQGKGSAVSFTKWKWKRVFFLKSLKRSVFLTAVVIVNKVLTIYSDTPLKWPSLGHASRVILIWLSICWIYQTGVAISRKFLSKRYKHGHTLKPFLFCSHYRAIKRGSWRSQSTPFRRSFNSDIFSFKALSHFCLVKNSLHCHMGSFNSLRVILRTQGSFPLIRHCHHSSDFNYVQQRVTVERSFALIICKLLAYNWSSVERYNVQIL